MYIFMHCVTTINYIQTSIYKHTTRDITLHISLLYDHVFHYITLLALYAYTPMYNHIMSLSIYIHTCYIVLQYMPMHDITLHTYKHTHTTRVHFPFRSDQ